MEGALLGFCLLEKADAAFFMQELVLDILPLARHALHIDRQCHGGELEGGQVTSTLANSDGRDQLCCCDGLCIVALARGP